MVSGKMKGFRQKFEPKKVAEMKSRENFENFECFCQSLKFWSIFLDFGAKIGILVGKNGIWTKKSVRNEISRKFNTY